MVRSQSLTKFLRVYQLRDIDLSKKESYSDSLSAGVVVEPTPPYTIPEAQSDLQAFLTVYSASTGFFKTPDQKFQKRTISMMSKRSKIGLTFVV